jgi:hypothetical protein
MHLRHEEVKVKDLYGGVDYQQVRHIGYHLELGKLVGLEAQFVGECMVRIPHIK